MSGAEFGWSADIAARAAIKDLEARLRRRKYGRIILELELVGGVCTGHRITEEDTTDRDVDRLMRERPRKPHGTGWPTL